MHRVKSMWLAQGDTMIQVNRMLQQEYATEKPGVRTMRSVAQVVSMQVHTCHRC